MTRATELRIKRINTVEFIRADQVKIELIRKQEVRNARRGVESTGDTHVPPQWFRLIKTDPKPNPERRTFGGKAVVQQDALLGTHKADIQDNDEFELFGHWYKVNYVDDKREYRTLATIVLRDAD